ncbi:MAG: signal peptidase I, partial [Oscillospiraceae bacterium]|nr:signal peptidase I [Oscillospiraceae bacterium]
MENKKKNGLNETNTENKQEAEKEVLPNVYLHPSGFLVRRSDSDSETETETEKKKPAKSKHFFKREFCDWFESLVFSVVTVIFIMVFFARVNQVYGNSMQPTLSDGDRLIVMSLYSMPKYGDIIVMEAENLPNSQTGELGEPIVKRVIGLPGDEIFIDRETGEVFRNGVKLYEVYIAEKILPEKVGKQVYPLLVGEGYVFVLG